MTDEERRTAKTAAESAEDITEPYPDSAIIAAALNQRHGFSVIVGEGRGKGGKTVIVEHISVDGIPVYRVKRTTYSFHRSRDAALEAAKKHGVKIQVFG